MNETSKNKIHYTIGENIRSIRYQKGWSQEDVANKLGISVPAFSRIETGVTDINLSRLEQIAHVYEISVTQLFADDGKEGKPTSAELKVDLKKIHESDVEIVNLQRKIILLYEELNKKPQL